MTDLSLECCTCPEAKQGKGPANRHSLELGPELKPHALLCKTTSALLRPMAVETSRMMEPGEDVGRATFFSATLIFLLPLHPPAF